MRLGGSRWLSMGVAWGEICLHLLLLSAYITVSCFSSARHLTYCEEKSTFAPLKCVCVGGFAGFVSQQQESNEDIMCYLKFFEIQ